jgi:tetrahydrodipicolinate N-succinyltransferase
VTAARSRLAHVARSILGHPIRSAGKVVALVRAQRLFRDCRRGTSVYAFGRVRVEGGLGIRLGDRITFVGGMVPTELLCDPGATLSVGAGTVMNYGASIEASRSVRIGQRCMLASFVRISDRGPAGSAEVTIGDDVWLAHGVIVEPGVTIGDGSVVSAGSVVTSDVPARSIAAGNPARSMSLAMTGAGRPAAPAGPVRQGAP